MAEPKKLSEITRAEWISFQWIDVTEGGDPERMFIKGYGRTPDEAMQAMEEWDVTAEERGVMPKATEGDEI